MGKKKLLTIGLVFVIGIGLLLNYSFKQEVFATGEIRLVVDGKIMDMDPGPIIQDDRTLVPIRFALEGLGADFDWDESNRTVTIKKDGISVLLRIDKHFVSYESEGKKYILTDVAPKIIDDRTFVPIRLISNIFGIHVDWDNNTRSVLIDSKKESLVEAFFDVEILNLDSGQSIEGKRELQIEIPEGSYNSGREIKYLLLEPDTGEGIVIARGDELGKSYTWLPSFQDQGEKVLVAAIYNSKGEFIAGDAVPVNINIKPKVELTGIKEGQVVNEKLAIGGDYNFAPYYINYEIVNLDNGKVVPTLEKSDPYGNFDWSPNVEEKGNYSFKLIAYDRDHKAYESKTIKAQIDMDRKLSLIGVTQGKEIEGPITLNASRNFNVTETEYILRDPKTLKEESLAKIGYGGYKWFPGPEYTGSKELLVRVKDTRGKAVDSKPVKVTLSGKPILLLQGIGPEQVVTGEVKLKVSSNKELKSVDYLLVNKNTGAKKTLASNVDPSTEFLYIPKDSDIGYWTIQAEATDDAGKKIKSEEIPFRVYLGKIYTKQPIVEKDKFKDLASDMARKSWEKTGMSAALQTAQAILETGWGQSVGVDKYTGVLSKNLFGIKGVGPAGSVTITTWEEYNGVSFTIDDDFRAYNSIEESWDDHKELLLTRSRYKPFTEVMHDSTQGAWAIRRAGYATDSQYPIKLMDIIRSNGLEKLDRIDL